MPSPKKPSVSLRVQQLGSRVLALEESVERHRTILLGLIEIFNGFLQKLGGDDSWGQDLADDWRQRGEALLEQDEKNRKREQLRKQIEEQRSKLLDLVLDLNLELRKLPDGSVPDEPEDRE